MTQSNLIQLAQQGNPQAIATLINRGTSSQGIVAKVVQKDDQLKIALKSEREPNKSQVVELICRGLQRLNIKNINLIQVSSFVSGSDLPVWSETISLNSWIDREKSSINLDPNTGHIRRNIDLNSPINSEDASTTRTLSNGLDSTQKPKPSVLISASKDKSLMKEVSLDEICAIFFGVFGGIIYFRSKQKSKNKRLAVLFLSLVTSLIYASLYSLPSTSNDHADTDQTEQAIEKGEPQVEQSPPSSSNETNEISNASNSLEDTGVSGVLAYEQVGPVEDYSLGTAKRVVARITIPTGHTRDEVSATLKQAAMVLAALHRADASTIFAYRPGDPIPGVYTVGMATYGPNGRWENAHIEGPKSVTVELSDLYFNSDNAQKFQIGDTVLLWSSSGDEILISSESKSWHEDYIFAKVPSGTQASIQKVDTYPMLNNELIRLRVKLNYDGRTVEGWIHSWDIKN